MPRFLLSLCLALLSLSAYGQDAPRFFKIRTITAGITVAGLNDTTSVLNAVQFLKQAMEEYTRAGYEVQTLRISTQNLYE